LWPPTYEAYTLLRIRQGPELVYLGVGGTINSTAHCHLLRSPIIIDAALAMPEVRSLPCISSRLSTKTEGTWLAQQIRCRALTGGKQGDGAVLKISMVGDDPQELRILVDAVTDAYMEKVAREERRLLAARHELLDSTYWTKMQELDRRRKLVRQIAERLGTHDLQEALAKQEQLLQLVLKLRQEITNAQAAIFHKERLPNLAESRQDVEIEDLKDKLDSMTEKSEELNSLLSDLGAAAEELARRQEDLAAVEETARRLSQTLEQYDLELRSPERITLLQGATVRRVPYGEK